MFVKSYKKIENWSRTQDRSERLFGFLIKRRSGGPPFQIRIHMEKFNLKKLNEVEGKMQYSVEISNRLAALETTRENIKISTKESIDYY
jgi:hypothetical protein